MQTLIIIGIVLALIATVCLWITVLPRKKEHEQKGKFLQFLFDYFHFKTLYIEGILKVLFTLATCACIFVGFLLLFGRIDYWYYSESSAGYGALLLIAGPIVSRLCYELIMMAILLVRNVMEINQKMHHGPHGHGPHGCGGHHGGEGCGCGHHHAPAPEASAQSAPASAQFASAQADAPAPEMPKAE